MLVVSSRSGPVGGLYVSGWNGRLKEEEKVRHDGTDRSRQGNGSV
jgi:hypothetical protein